MRNRSFGVAVVVVMGCSAGEKAGPSSVDAGSAAMQSSNDAVARLTRFDAFRGQLGRGGKLAATADGFVAPSKSSSFSARVGRTAREPVRLSHPTNETLWIEVAAEDLYPVAAVVDEGAIVFANAAADTDVVDVVGANHFEEVRLLRSSAAPTRARYLFRTGPGIATVRVREGHVEAVDATGYVHFATAPLFAVDAKGTERRAEVRLDGDVVEVSLSTDGLEYPIALDPLWSAVANLTYRHTEPKVTRLSSGKVLAVAGGGTGASFSELYDPAANTWSSAAIGDAFGGDHWIVPLGADKILLGGYTGVMTYVWEPTGPAGGTWTRKADASTSRAQPVAVAISGGALVAGGFNGTYLSTAEFYDPVANTWTPRASMPTARWAAGGGVVGGRVIAAGGYNTGGALSVVEEYNPTTNSWTPKTSLPAERYTPASIVLADGRLMLVGGSLDNGTRHASAAFYSSAGSWTIVPMAHPRTYLPGVAQLASGRVLVVGAPEGVPPYVESEVFDPGLNKFVAGAPSLVSRDKPGVAVLGTAGDKAIALGGMTSASSNTAEVFTDMPLGTACSGTSPCSVGTCVDGYCCESACTEQCKACDVPGSLGRCANVDAQPPHGTRMSCSPYFLCSAGACATTCANDAQCAADSYCNAGSCVLDKTQGSACTATTQCRAPLTCTDGYCCNASSCGAGASCGNAGALGVCSKNLGTACSSGDTVACASGHCVDGVCCNTACTGACAACTTAKTGSANGTCASITDGTDPDNECPAASCAGASLNNKQVCNGSGACRANGVTACAAGYLCVGTACATSCTSDASCASTHYCAGGSCVAKKASGTACSAANECSSGFCADGVCCNEACGGCRACTAALKGTGSDGTCGNAAADTDPHNSCAPDSEYPKSCKADGMCNGAGACREYAKASTACDVTTCTGGSIVGKICNGAGLCESSTGVSCAPYACGGSACATSCTSDANCAGTAFCSSAGTCVTKKAAGEACSATKECTTGFCADGVCCDTACDGQCQACDVTGNVGKCSLVSGKPHGTRPACTGEGTTCGGTCDATSATACSYPGATTACGSSCADGTETKKVCDAKGACVDGVTSKCLPYACADSTKCGAACSVDTECAAGFRCSGGVCAPPASNTCSPDLLSTIDASGTATSCGAYRCEKETGACRKICNATEECASGFVCNSSTKTCDPAPAPVADDGGCAIHYGRRSTGGAAMFAVLLVSLLVRRRRDAFIQR